MSYPPVVFTLPQALNDDALMELRNAGYLVVEVNDFSEVKLVTAEHALAELGYVPLLRAAAQAIMGCQHDTPKRMFGSLVAEAILAKSEP